jgi:hypothetical protein
MAEHKDQSVATKKITVSVVYNGLTKELELQPHMTVTAALQQALNAFNVQDQRHVQAFYRENGSEVTPENVSLTEAGIEDKALLALRPSAVKGGDT